MTTRKLGGWALEGLKLTAMSRASPNEKGVARSRLVAVYYYPLSRRVAYHGRAGVISKTVALMELEKEAKLDGLY
jgi:hypothetical protein